MVNPEPGSGTQLVILSAGNSEVTRAEQIQVSPTWWQKYTRCGVRIFTESGSKSCLDSRSEGQVLEGVMGVGERAVRAPCWKGSGDEWELAKEGVGADSAAADQKDEERKVWAWRGGSWVGTLKSDFIVVVGLKTNAEEWWVRENILDTGCHLSSQGDHCGGGICST